MQEHIPYIIGGALVVAGVLFALNKREKKPAPLSALSIDIVGDSTGHRDGAKVPAKYKGFKPNKHIERMSRLRVKNNFAHGGWTTERILAEQVPLALVSNSPVVWVMGSGINDILQGLPVSQTIANNKRIDELLVAKGKRVVRFGIQHCKWDTATEQVKANQINRAIDGVKLHLSDKHIAENDKYHVNDEGMTVLVSGGLQLMKERGWL